MDAIIKRVVAEVLQQLQQDEQEEFLPPYMQPARRSRVTITVTKTTVTKIEIDLPSISEMEYRRLHRGE